MVPSGSAPDAIQHVALAALPERALSSLAAPFARWFTGTLGSPTVVQRLAWPTLASGNNLLLCAPTGSGKTLAAFLPLLSRLHETPKRGLRCLYIAPLKALIADAARNLRRCLRQVQRTNPELRPIRLATWTGDTSAHQRRRLHERPPHLLLTTPESLAVLLANPRGEELCRSLEYVVVDELHALAGNKRGADLALSLERIEEIAAAPSHARLQRVGLSATCAPIEQIARFLVGVGRACTVARAPDQSPMEIRVEPLPAPASSERPAGYLARLVERLGREIRRNRTTLVFTNIRSIAEQVAWVLKRRWPRLAPKVGVHHSSMSAQRRRAVEARLKKGLLRVVVSSTSLELGIDIGTIDGVVFVHPPGGVARLLQRLGRSGHRPGQPRRGLFLTGGDADLLEAVVTATAARARQLDPIRIPDAPLDVLCQHVCGLAMTGWRRPDDVFRLLRRAYAYRNLARNDFDRCLDYLSGRHADGRAWLPPRLRWEDARFAIRDARTTRLLRRNLGTILSEDPRAIRLLLSQAPTASRDEETPPTCLVGTLDDGYADRLQPGDRFLLGARCFEFRKFADGDLLVQDSSSPPLVPHWTGSGWNLSPELARRLFLFRQQAAEALREGREAFRRLLRVEYCLRAAAIDELRRFLLRQEAVSEIPKLPALLVECLDAGNGVSCFVHTPLNRPGNDALARLAAWRLGGERGEVIGTVAADLGFLVETPYPADAANPELWRRLFSLSGFDDDLDRALYDCQSLRDRFARNAAIGLMAPRNLFGPRRRVGGHGWAARRLFDQVRRADPDFVLLRQAERELRAETCDVDAARAYLADLPRLAIHCRWLAEVSPFAESWTQPAEITDHDTPERPLSEREAALAQLHRRLFSDVG